MCAECRNEFVRLLQDRINFILMGAVGSTQEEQEAARAHCFHLMELSLGLTKAGA